MEDPQSPLNLTVDMSGPSRVSECLDALVAFPAAIQRMRESSDTTELPQMMRKGTQVAFDALTPADLGDLRVAAGNAQDLLYRYIMEITIMDEYTYAYCDQTLRHFFGELSRRDIRTYYILDNSLREDRFQAMLHLFKRSGITPVTPRYDGLAWSDLATKIRTQALTTGHAAYIEPDAVVNHLDSARELAQQLSCVATFRNLHPDDPQIEMLKV